MSTPQTDAHNEREQAIREGVLTPEGTHGEERGRELQEQAEERESERMDQHFAPAEGFQL